MQNFSHLVQGKHLKIEGLMKGLRNLMANWPYLGNGKR